MNLDFTKKIRVNDPLTGKVIELSREEVVEIQESGVYIPEESIVKEENES